MGARDAWVAFSLMTAALVTAVALYLISSGEDAYQITAFAIILISIYLYIVYKRYHIELVTEGDVRLFTDPDDLRILTEIYGLGSSDKHYINRQRLLDFSRKNKGTSFVWVAPLIVGLVGGVFSKEVPEPVEEPTAAALMKRLLSEKPSESSLSGPLLWGSSRSKERLTTLRSCPVCESPQGTDAKPVCAECGADLEFYSVLAESRVGRRLIQRKTSGKRRLRYSVPTMPEQ